MNDEGATKPLKRITTIRVYVDTSVFGGMFDAEFVRATKRFFEEVDSGRFLLVVSLIVADEITDAPPRVRQIYEKFMSLAEVSAVAESALALRDAYLRAGIVAPQWSADALHVALATVTGCAMIVSWNFKHIVNFRRISLYNAVNRKNGYGEIGIFTPQEVIEDEDEVV
jgi:predicted nucleic acid-binding protein